MALGSFAATANTFNVTPAAGTTWTLEARKAINIFMTVPITTSVTTLTLTVDITNGLESMKPMTLGLSINPSLILEQGKTYSYTFIAGVGTEVTKIPRNEYAIWNEVNNYASKEDIMSILGSGVYWDDEGPEWMDKDGRTHRTGLWIKKSEWTGTPTTEAIPLPTSSDIRKNTNWKFLPAAGCKSIKQDNFNVSGNYGYYWSNKMVLEGEAIGTAVGNIWTLNFNKNKAGLVADNPPANELRGLFLE